LAQPQVRRLRSPGFKDEDNHRTQSLMNGKLFLRCALPWRFPVLFQALSRQAMAPAVWMNFINCACPQPPNGPPNGPRDRTMTSPRRFSETRCSKRRSRRQGSTRPTLTAHGERARFGRSSGQFSRPMARPISLGRPGALQVGSWRHADRLKRRSPPALDSSTTVLLA
jgi:hypothetical protein